MFTPSRPGLYLPYGKRLLDVVGASLALLIVLPFMGLIAAAIFIRMGGQFSIQSAEQARMGNPSCCGSSGR